MATEAHAGENAGLPSLVKIIVRMGGMPAADAAAMAPSRKATAPRLLPCIEWRYQVMASRAWSDACP